MVIKRVKILVLFIGIYCLMTIFFGCVLTNKNVRDTNDVELFNVTLKTTQTQKYCGGAPPPAEIFEDQYRKKVYPNVKVYIRKGETNNFTEKPFKVITTDTLGIANIELPADNYVFVFEYKSSSKKYKKLIESIEKSKEFRDLDKGCLKLFFEQPDGSLTVSGQKMDTVFLNRSFKCPWTEIPCVTYIGDLPPSIRDY